MKSKLLLLLLIIPAFWALTRPGFFPMHDDIQGMRVFQMHKCILDFQIPCRWVADMGFGYGYPQFNYYAPLPYYLMEIPVLLGSQILSSVKLGFIASLIFSGLGMYLLGTYLWGKKGGLVSAMFYVYAPYRAVDIYVRGAMGESWAFVFLPFILLFTLKILDGRKSILALALSFAGLLLSHNVTVLMFIPFYLIFVFAAKKIKLNNLKHLLISGLWGVALSAFFILPAYFEKEFVHVNTILMGYFNYLAHFVGIKQLLFSSYWGYGSSGLGPLDGLNLSVGILHWTTPVALIVVMIYLRRFKEVRPVVLLTALGFLALFMIHPKSQFIWDNLPILSYVQFPWRFLMIAVLFFSLAAGSVGSLLVQYKKVFLLATFIVLVLLYGSYFKPEKVIQITDGEKFSGESWMLQQTISIFDYLPVSAAYPPAQKAPDAPKILNGKAILIDGEKGTNWQRWKIYVESETSQVQLALFDFPNWLTKIDGEPVRNFRTGELGLVTLNVDRGEHLLEAKLSDTTLRMFSNIISFVALIAVPIFIRKKGYRKGV